MSLTKVTRDQFFATVGQMNVHPKVDVSTLRGRYHTSNWETPQREVVGRSVTDSYGIDPGQYFARKT